MINPPSAEKAQLLQGTPGAQSDDETFAAIRAVLTDAEAEFDRKASDVEAPRWGKRVAHAARASEVMHVSSEPEAPVDDGEKVSDGDHKNARKLALPRIALPTILGAKMSLLGYRPKTKHVALVALLLVLWFRPHWVVLSLFLVVFVVLGLFAIAGADAVWNMLARHFARMAVRNPQRAARLAVRMDAFALKWDAILDRFPERLVEGLYLPDFQAYQQVDERHAAAVDARLSRMQSEA